MKNWLWAIGTAFLISSAALLALVFVVVVLRSIWHIVEFVWNVA